MRSLRREPGVLLALLAVIVPVLIFIVYPQVRVVVTPGDSYVEFFTGGTWRNSLVHSLEVMALSTTTAVTLGFIYAYAMVYSDMHWKPFFRLVGILPLLSPPFVVAASYVILFGPRGIITYGVFGQTISVFGLSGIWGVQTIAFFPFAYQLIADVLSRSDARMEQAARNLGAGSWGVFRTVTLPLSRPGLGAAILTTAIYVLEDFGNPALIGKNRAVVANTLRLLNLPQELQDAVADGTISAGHARNLVSIGDEALQRQTAERILNELAESQNNIVDSFRNPADIEAFSRRPDYVLWAVTDIPDELPPWYAFRSAIIS